MSVAPTGDGAALLQVLTKTQPQLDQMMQLLNMRASGAGNQLAPMWAAAVGLRNRDKPRFVTMAKLSFDAPPGAGRDQSPRWLQSFAALSFDYGKATGLQDYAGLVEQLPKHMAQTRKAIAGGDAASALPGLALAALGRVLERHSMHPGNRTRTLDHFRAQAFDFGGRQPGQPVTTVGIRPTAQSEFGQLAGLPAHYAAMGLMQSLRGTDAAQWQPSVLQTLFTLAQRCTEPEMDRPMLQEMRREVGDLLKDMTPGNPFATQAAAALLNTASADVRPQDVNRMGLAVLRQRLDDRLALQQHAETLVNDIDAFVALHKSGQHGDLQAMRQVANRASEFVTLSQQVAQDQQRLVSLLRQREAQPAGAAGTAPPATPWAATDLAGERAPSAATYAQPQHFINDMRLQRGPLATLDKGTQALLDAKLPELAQTMAATQAKAPAPGGQRSAWSWGSRGSTPKAVIPDGYAQRAQQLNNGAQHLRTRAADTAQVLRQLNDGYKMLDASVFGSTVQLRQVAIDNAWQRAVDIA